jgi:hypothetical protein
MIISVLFLILLSSCSESDVAVISSTEVISPTVAPTKTPIPPTATKTPTLVPTQTLTPTITFTPEPTATLEPVAPIGELQGDVFFKICYFLGMLDENNLPIDPCPIVEPESLTGDYRSKFLAFSLDYNWPLGYGIVRSDVRESPFCDYDIYDKESSCGDHGLIVLPAEQEIEGEGVDLGSVIYKTYLDSHLGGEYFLVEVSRMTVDNLVPGLDIDNHRDDFLKNYVLERMYILWPLTHDQYSVLLDNLRLHGMDWKIRY